MFKVIFSKLYKLVEISTSFFYFITNYLNNYVIYERFRRNNRI